MNFPLIGYGWIVASIACWAVVFLMRSVIKKHNGRVITAAFYSFMAVALSFSIYSASTVVSWLSGEAFIPGFIVGDVLAVFFLAGQTSVAWLLAVKRYVPKILFAGIVSVLAIIDIALRTAALTAQNGFVLKDGEFTKTQPSSLIPIIELIFLSTLLFTGLFLIWRSIRSLSLSGSLRYGVMGAIASIGALLYIYDNIFIRSSGLSDTVAIVNIAAYPLLALAVFMTIRFSSDV